MFFSTELLAYKTSIFHRIWILAQKSEKLQNEDLSIKTIKIADSVLEWMKREDQMRASLPIGLDMALGISRLVNHQLKRLRKDYDKLKEKMRDAREKAVGDRIDIDEAIAIAIDITTAAPEMQDNFEMDFSNVVQARREDITLREDHLLPPPNFEEAEQDDDFGEG